MLSHFSHVRCFETIWTVTFQAPLSMGFSWQEYWSGLPCPSPGDLQGLKLCLLCFLAGGFFTTSDTWETQVHMCVCVCACVCMYLIESFVDSLLFARQCSNILLLLIHLTLTILQLLWYSYHYFTHKERRMEILKNLTMVTQARCVCFFICWNYNSSPGKPGSKLQCSIVCKMGIQFSKTTWIFIQ